MFWLVEDNKQLEIFKNYCKGDVFIEIIPLIPSGNFFNNWLSMIFFFKIGVLLFFLEESYNKKIND